MSLVEHAERELALIPEDDEAFKDAILQAVKAFSKYGHSGSSHFVGVHILADLLNYRNLSPLTNDPDEWMFITDDIAGRKGGLYQSTRNPEAFSHNGGKTYYLLSEGANMLNPKPVHRTRKVVK